MRCLLLEEALLVPLVVTYRQACLVVAGMRLTVSVTRRWHFRRTERIRGELLHASFSLRALRQAGFALPQPDASGRMLPSERSAGDPRLAQALEACAAGRPADVAGTRCVLLDVLEDDPACLQAHAALGLILTDIVETQPALLHLTAAIRLGLGALVREDCLPLDPSRPVERWLLRALVGRARLLLSQGRADAAACDLQRALSWDPTDACESAELLKQATTESVQLRPGRLT